VSRMDDNNIYGPPSAAVGTTRFGRNVPGRSTVHGGTVQDHAATAARNLPVEPPRAAPLGRHSKMSFLDKLASRFKRYIYSYWEGYTTVTLCYSGTCYNTCYFSLYYVSLLLCDFCLIIALFITNFYIITNYYKFPVRSLFSLYFIIFQY